MSRSDYWREEIVIPADDSSGPVFFPDRARDISVKVIPGSGGSARVEITLDDERDVREDPASADWESWEPGDVSDSTSRALLGVVTAVRGVATTEAAVLQVVAAKDF